VRGDVAQQPAHAQPRGNEREHETHHEHRHVATAEAVALLPEAVHAGADQRRDRQVERKIRGGLARQAEQHAADDGRAAAARARNQRQALRQADLERIRPMHLLDRLDAHDRVVPTLGPQDDERAEDEGRCHHRRREEVLLDHLAQSQAEHHGRQEGHQHVEREALRVAAARQRGDGVADLLPVHQDDRQDGARLDRDVEDLRLLVVEVQQRTREDEVARAGHRQEFGEPLDDAHDRGLHQQNDVHASSLQKRWIMQGALQAGAALPSPSSDRRCREPADPLAYGAYRQIHSRRHHGRL
jgi:hypothetical protein